MSHVTKGVIGTTMATIINKAAAKETVAVVMATAKVTVGSGGSSSIGETTTAATAMATAMAKMAVIEVTI